MSSPSHLALETHEKQVQVQLPTFDIQERTYKFAVRIVRLCKHLDGKAGIGRILCDQLLRSGTSIGANMQEAKAAQSKADFIYKCTVALKEARETHFWLRLLAESNTLSPGRLSDIQTEVEEIMNIIASIIVSAKSRR